MQVCPLLSWHLVLSLLSPDFCHIVFLFSTCFYMVSHLCVCASHTFSPALCAIYKYSYTGHRTFETLPVLFGTKAWAGAEEYGKCLLNGTFHAVCRRHLPLLSQVRLTSASATFQQRPIFGKGQTAAPSAGGYQPKSSSCSDPFSTVLV